MNIKCYYVLFTISLVYIYIENECDVLGSVSMPINNNNFWVGDSFKWWAQGQVNYNHNIITIDFQ